MKTPQKLFSTFALSIAVLIPTGWLGSQPSLGDRPAVVVTKDTTAPSLAGLTWRSIGPAFFGGRVVDIAVADEHTDSPGRTFYIAAATGGIWRTNNGGTSWTSLFDKQSVGSMGAVAVAPSSPNIVWVGTGESNNQRSSSWGDGVYKSTDSGVTWTKMGLERSQHVGRIVVHPTNPNIVYVAAAGPLWADGGDRGLYRTADGGTTWKSVIPLDQYTGVVDVAIDPKNPDNVYAAAYQRQRSAFNFVGGGPGTGIYRSTDGGNTWTRVTAGLPSREMGRIGLSVSRSHPNVVYATIETDQAEVYRSDDHGVTWRKTGVNYSYPWYMGQIRADPVDPDKVYFLGVGMAVSPDGGKSWKGIFGQSHADHHALWINPKNPNHLIDGDDGGIHISFDGGATSKYHRNLPISQFYAIGVTNDEPFYKVYGGTQDNNSWGAPNATRSWSGVTGADWHITTGGDGFYAVIDPNDPNTVYSESQHGGIVRYDAATGVTKSIQPDEQTGEKAFRFNWSAPILLSPHDSKTVYFGANLLFKSTDRGDSWTRLGGDHTRQISHDTLKLMGKVWPKNAVAYHQGVAFFGNITTIDESPVQKGVLYTGTDDGLINVSTDGGATWTRIDRFPGVPNWTYVSRVTASNKDAGTAYATFDGHRSNDFTPYVYKTTDFGKTWTSITSNLPTGSVQVIREHPRNPNVLFLGTEFTIYVSIDGGKRWISLRNGLPAVPIHDIVIHPKMNDLVIGTHGRGIYIMDDITALERLAEAVSAASPVTVFQSRPAVRYLRQLSSGGRDDFSGQNPKDGAYIDYYVREELPAGATLTLTILDQGSVVRSYPIEGSVGLHRAIWNTSRARVTPLQDGGKIQPDDGSSAGVDMPPGTYTARLSVTKTDQTSTASVETKVVVQDDPMVKLTAEDWRALTDARLEAERLQVTMGTFMRMATQITKELDEATNVVRGTKGPAPLVARADSLKKDLEAIMTPIRGPQRSFAGRTLWDVDTSAIYVSLQSKLGRAAWDLDYPLTGPTAKAKADLADAAKGLAVAMKDIAAFHQQLLAFYDALDAAGVPWTIGRKIIVK